MHQLKEIYTSVNAIDLIMGLISEIPVNGATVGPTSVCIIGMLFFFFFIMLKFNIIRRRCNFFFMWNIDVIVCLKIDVHFFFGMVYRDRYYTLYS